MKFITSADTWLTLTAGSAKRYARGRAATSLGGAFLALAFLTTGGAFAAQPPGPVKHVVIQINENQNFADTFNVANAPYMTALIQQRGAIATNFYANTHPSIGNYFELLTGQILTNDDAQTPATFPISIDNLIRQINAAGYTWKAYCESIPSVGYMGGDSGLYAVRHCAVPYLTDVQNNATQRQNVVDFSQFTIDLQNNQLPAFSFVVPNLINDGHDTDIATGDAWIQSNMAQLFNSPSFNQDTVYIFTWDEAGTDDTFGGGRIETAFLGATVKQAYSQQSSTLYQQASTGRTILWLLGITPPSDMHDITTAPVMSEFFNPASSATLPAISSFTASPQSITAGQGSTLSWVVSGSPAPTLSIDNGVGTVTGASQSVFPSVTTTYTLTATNSAGSVSRSVIVTVAAATSAPLISSLTASPAAITAGQTSTLSWSVSGVPSPALSIDSAIGAVTGTSKVVSPAATTTYTLTATNGAGSASKSVTITVSAATSAPVISSFTASPSAITVGGGSTLSWTVAGVPTPTVSIDNGVGTVTGTSKPVFPAATTTYTLTAASAGASVSTAVTVTVTSVSGARTFYVDPVAGSDSNSGTSAASAWRTLAKVNSFSLLPGDMILFKRGGVWNEQLNVIQSGTANNPITYDAYGAGNPPLFTLAVNGIHVSGASNVVLRNLSVSRSQSFGILVDGGSKNNVLDTVDSSFNGDWGIWLSDAGTTGNQVLNCSSHDNPNGGMQFNPGADNNTVTGGTYYNNTGQYASGVEFDSSGNTASGVVSYNNWYGLKMYGGAGSEARTQNNRFYDNTAYGNSSFGIDVDFTGTGNIVEHNVSRNNGEHGISIEGTTSGAIVRYNIVHNNGAGLGGIELDGTTNTQVHCNLIYGEGNGIWVLGDVNTGHAINPQIYNNTIYNSNYCISVNNQATQVTLRNNIAASCGSATLSVAGDSQAGFSSDYNDWQMNGGSNISWGGRAYTLASFRSATSQEGHSLDVDPMVANAGAADFTLQAASPVIDKGVNVGLPFQGAAPDMGAFEYAGTSVPPPPAAPVISSFTATPASITTGQSSTLSWNVTGATSLSLYGVGAVSPLTTGSASVSPTATTVYVLTATNSGGSTTAQVTVTVTVPPPPPAAPVISSFTASPTAITTGQSSTLTWNVTGAASLSISGLGAVSPLTAGSASVSPTATTVYVLTAMNTGGSATAQVTVTVTVPPPPPAAPVISSFTASPNAITTGQSSTLTWNVTGAASLSISGVGAVSPPSAGSVSVSPTATTVYVLTATNAGGSTTGQATVTVTAPPPPPSAPVISSFTANPAAITTGQSSTLTWNVTGAASLSISGVGAVSPLTAGSASVSPAATTTYVLTATNSVGSVTATTSVAVTNPPPPPPPSSFLGYLDYISSDNGEVGGWATNQANPTVSIPVSLYIDVPPTQGGVPAVTIIANIPRADVNQVTGQPGDHGFQARIPSQYLDGKQHTLYVYADTQANVPVYALIDTPATFSINPYLGYLDYVSSSGEVGGWATNQADPNTSIPVSLYIDVPPTQGGVAAVTVLANVPRSDVNHVTGQPGDHGFVALIPAQYHDGKNHTVYVYADTGAKVPVFALIYSPVAFSLR